jgi:hypothetical protein
VANTLREWVVSLTYLIDKASQNQAIQSAKQVSQAVNQAATQQTAASQQLAAAVQHATATQVRGHAATTQAAQQTATRVAAAATTQGTAQVAAANRAVTVTTQATRQTTAAVTTAATAQTAVQVAAASRAAAALAAQRAAQVQAWTQWGNQVGEALGNHLGNAIVRAGGSAIRDLRGIVSTGVSLIHPMTMAIGAATLAAVGNIGFMTNGLDKLYNLAQKTGSSSVDLRALRQTTSMMGGSEDQADNMASSLSDARRSNRGIDEMLKGMGVTDFSGSVKILEQFSDIIRTMPSDVAQKYGQVANLSPEDIRFLQSPSFKRQMAANREELQKLAGDEEAATRAGKALADEWRKFTFSLSTLNRNIALSFLEGSRGIFDAVNVWLTKNKVGIASAIRGFTDEISKLFIGIGEEFVKVFADTEEGKAKRKEWVDWFQQIKQDAIDFKDAILDAAKAIVYVAGLLGFTGNSALKRKEQAKKEGVGDTAAGIEGFLGPEATYLRHNIEKIKPGNEAADPETGIQPGYFTDDMKAVGSWLKGIFGITAENNTEASKNFKEDVGKFGQAVDRLPGGRLSGPGKTGASETGTATSNGSTGTPAPDGSSTGTQATPSFSERIAGAFKGRPKVLGGTGEGIIEGFKGPASSEAPRGDGQGTRGSARMGDMMGYAMDQLRREGVPEANLRKAAANLVGQAHMESGLDPNKTHDDGTGYGIYGARDPTPGKGRRTDMLRWLEKNGYARNSAEGQMRYMAHEAMTKFPATRQALISGAFGAGVTNLITKEFESPAVVNYRHGAVAQAFGSASSDDVLKKIRSTAANVGKGISDIAIPPAAAAAARNNNDNVITDTSFANPGRYIGPSQTQDNSKKIDFDAIYNTSINTTEPRQAATAFQRAHEQLNAMSQRQLQGMYR